MRNYFLIPIFLIVFDSIIAQTVHTRIGGVLQEMNTKIGINEVAVFLIKNKDTISRSCSDSTGHFRFELDCSVENEYSIGYIFDDRKYKKVQIGIVYDSTELMEYFLELGIFMQSEFKKNELSEFYEFDQTQKDSLVDLYWLKQFLDENSTIYLKFKQFVNPKESRRIVKKRYENFMELLEIANIDHSRIVFDFDPILLGEFDLNYDSRSRFSGKVIPEP